MGAVLLDEFHERSVEADLALTLLLDLQRLARPHLRHVFYAPIPALQWCKLHFDDASAVLLPSRHNACLWHMDDNACAATLLSLECNRAHRTVVMSATLGGGLGERVAALMPACPLDNDAAQQAADAPEGSPANAPLLVSQGRSFPVKTHFLGLPGAPICSKRSARPAVSLRLAGAKAAHKLVLETRSAQDSTAMCAAGRGRLDLERAVTSAVIKALAACPGDVLVFLPGVGEIRAVQRMLAAAALPGPPVRVLPLHGMLSPHEQDEAVQTAPGQQLKDASANSNLGAFCHLVARHFPRQSRARTSCLPI